MKQLIALALGLLMSFSAVADVDPQWNQLTTKIVNEGYYTPTDFADYLSLADIQPTDDREKDRVASYISVVGGYDQDGVFQFGRVEAVWEDWKRDAEGNFHVDQWLFQLGADEQMWRYSHSIRVFTPTGTLLDSEDPPTTDNEFNKKWNEILQKWYDGLVH